MPCEIRSVSVVTLKPCGVHIFSYFANLHIYLHMLRLFGCVHMLLCLLLSVRVHMLSITVVSRDGGDSVAMPQRYMPLPHSPTGSSQHTSRGTPMPQTESLHTWRVISEQIVKQKHPLQLSKCV